MNKKYYFCILIILLLTVNKFYGFGVVKVSGDSMSPTLNDGDRKVYCKKCTAKVGDIVIYKDQDILDGTVIIKRVTEISDGKVFLNGDNNEKSTDSDDFGKVDESGIIGVVI